MESAKCKGVSNSAFDPFFPSSNKMRELAIATYCVHCPVQDDCDAYATRHKINHGIWGGKQRGKSDS